MITPSARGPAAGPRIEDRQLQRPTVREIRHTDDGAEWVAGVRRNHGVHVEAGAAGHDSAVELLAIVRREPLLRIEYAWRPGFPPSIRCRDGPPRGTPCHRNDHCRNGDP